MKKNISRLLAFSLLANAAVCLPVHGAGLENVYADINGVTVKLDSSDTDISQCSLEVNGAEVSGEFFANGKELSFVPEGQLDTDVVYKLTVGDEEKEFKIKTVFYEDFDNIDDTYISDSADFSNSFGTFNVSVTDATDSSAMIKDGKLMLAGSTFKVTSLEDVLETYGYTLSADIKGGGKRATTNSGGTSPATKGYVDIIMNMGTELGLQLKNKAINIGNVSSGAFASLKDGTYSADGAEYAFNQITSNEKLLDEAAFSNIEFKSEPDENTVVFRKVDTDYSGVVNGDTKVSYQSSAESSDDFGIYANKSTLAIIDNIRVTCYTEDVEAAEEGELRAVSLDGDFENLYLDFDRSLKGIKTFKGIKVYKNDVEITNECEIKIADKKEQDNKTVSITPSGYLAGNTFKVTVDTGFGTKVLKTEEGFEFEKEIVPGDISVLEGEITTAGIKVVFDENIEAVDEKLIEVYENDELVEADISYEKDTLNVIPKSFKIKNVYKIVVKPGFGGINRTLKEEYSYEQLLLKAEVTVEKVSGGKELVSITFSTDISDLKNSGAFKVIDDQGKVLNTKVSLKGKVADITYSEGFEKDKIYEVSVDPFETDAVMLDKAFRKGFKIETISYEDFEDDDLDTTYMNYGSTQMYVDKDGNRRNLMYSRALTIDSGLLTTEENFDISYDFWLYNACMNNNDKKYDDNMPFSLLEFNLDNNPTTTSYSSSTGGVQLYLSHKSVIHHAKKKGVDTTVRTVAFEHDGWRFGDMYYDSITKNFNIYQFGDELPVAKIKSDGSEVTHSEREESPKYHMEIRKSGVNFTLIRTTPEGVVEKPLTFAISEDGYPTTGKVRLTPQGTEGWSVDNVEITMFKLMETADIEVNAAEYSVSGDKVSGEFRVVSFDEKDNDVRVIAAVYGKDNYMQSMKIYDIASLEAGKDVRLKIEADAGEEVTGVKIFLLDSLDKLKVYAIADAELK